MTPKPTRSDLIVIGAGAAGLSVASGAVQMGASVTLIEAGEMGGDCLNHGCVPSKTLIAAAARAHQMRDAGRFGITPVEPQVNFAAVMDHVRSVIAGIAPHDSQERFEGLGARVLRAHARFVGPRLIEVAGERLTARRIVIATGSRPFVPPIPGLDTVEYLTNETIFGLDALPGHLAILGGGPIGAELAQAFRRLGAEVTLIDSGTILSREDPQAVAFVREAMKREGLAIREDTRIASVEGGAGAIRLHPETGEEIEATHLLVATGRTAGVDGLGLEAAGIRADTRGIETDARLRTSDRHVYAIGDVVADAPSFTHVAGYHAGIVIRQAMLGLPARADHSRIPRVTYTSPELAQLGPTEAEARSARRKGGQSVAVAMAEGGAAGADPAATTDARTDVIPTSYLRYTDNDRARTEKATEGFVKLLIRKGKPHGVTIVGPQAGDLLAPWVQAMASGTRLTVISGLVLPYPTLPELGKRAAGAYLSPKLFDNPWVERVVRLIQRVLP